MGDEGQEEWMILARFRVEGPVSGFTRRRETL